MMFEVIVPSGLMVMWFNARKLTDEPSEPVTWIWKVPVSSICPVAGLRFPPSHAVTCPVKTTLST